MALLIENHQEGEYYWSILQKDLPIVYKMLVAGWINPNRFKCDGTRNAVAMHFLDGSRLHVKTSKRQFARFRSYVGGKRTWPFKDTHHPYPGL